MQGGHLTPMFFAYFFPLPLCSPLCLSDSSSFLRCLCYLLCLHFSVLLFQDLMLCDTMCYAVRYDVLATHSFTPPLCFFVQIPRPKATAPWAHFLHRSGLFRPPKLANELMCATEASASIYGGPFAFSWVCT